jgi:hypothetical protein
MLNLTCPSNGDCVHVLTNPFNQSPGTTIKGITLIGNGTAASGLHIGDVTMVSLDDVEIKSFTSTSVSDGTGSSGAVGLWIDNVRGFTERLVANRVGLDFNTIGMKVTNSSPGCSVNESSMSYWQPGQFDIRVNGGSIGIEIGAGITMGHGHLMAQMNGNSPGSKTFFQVDGASGSCAAAALNNGVLDFQVEDNSSGGGTFLSLASGTSVSGNCFFHNFSSGFTNKLSGTLACQQYLGATGNQPILDTRTFSSTVERTTLLSDGASIDTDLALARNSAMAEHHIVDVGTAGDSCNGSARADLCIRNDNTNNLISFTVGGTPSLSITNTGIKSTQGLQVFNTTTTCTTAPAAGATCTTGAISLPVTEPDTAYRVVCTGKGVTNVPVVIATTNSSASQFTITIAAITEAAATFSSYDCIAGHN